MTSLAPRTILINGAASPVGAAIVRVFAQQGWNVVAAVRPDEPDLGLADLAHVVVVTVGAGDLAGVDAAANAGADRFGSLSCLVNVLGFAMGDESLPNSEVFAALDMTRETLPHLRRLRGVIVNVAPRVGYGFDAEPCPAVESLTERLGAELAALGVVVRQVDAAAATAAWSPEPPQDALRSLAETVYRAAVRPAPGWPVQPVRGAAVQDGLRLVGARGD